MVTYPTETRVECLNQIRPGKICGAHLPAGKTWCPVCGERTTTRRVDAFDAPPHEMRSQALPPSSPRTLQFNDTRVPFTEWPRDGGLFH